jgi:hypothetical protein
VRHGNRTVDNTASSDQVSGDGRRSLEPGLSNRMIWVGVGASQIDDVMDGGDSRLLELGCYRNSHFNVDHLTSLLMRSNNCEREMQAASPDRARHKDHRKSACIKLRGRRATRCSQIKTEPTPEIRSLFRTAIMYFPRCEIQIASSLDTRLLSVCPNNIVKSLCPLIEATSVVAGPSSKAG